RQVLDEFSYSRRPFPAASAFALLPDRAPMAGDGRSDRPPAYAPRSMSPAPLLALCGVDEVNAEEPLRVEIDGFAYAVYRLGEKYFVTADQCTHGPGLLSEGAVIGEEIECPFHQGRFHIPSGAPTLPPCTEPVRVWTAHLCDGRICIDPDERRSS